ncbi:MAG: hypothetical protein ACKV2O_02810 [Acidimicrobiales bacterium]
MMSAALQPGLWWWPLVLVNAVLWLGLSILIGMVAARLPDRCFARERWLTRVRAFEQDGRFWKRRLRIHRWKDRLPEAGATFGGRSKRRCPARDQLLVAVIDTRRAELVHWVLLACGPLFALWNPASLTLAMLAFAMVANLPCLVVQRYNRARMCRLLNANRPRTPRHPAVPSGSPGTVSRVGGS